MKNRFPLFPLLPLLHLAFGNILLNTKDTKPAPTTTQQQSQSAIKNTKDFGNYDVIMRDDAIGQNKNAPVDYYMLALSWSPAFCEKQRAQYGNNLPDSAQYQCSTKNQFGWVVHGLWRKMRMHALLRITLVFVMVIYRHFQLKRSSLTFQSRQAQNCCKANGKNTVAVRLIQQKLISNKRKHYLNRFLCQTNN